ncbi:MAG: 1-acyl-sn-glycerol-3-phosphate acyltransferase [uncultured Acidimicrobiales bacterium]|uniref:1-acyl-sn-glycerol-3-phosphate acyltransferase n=1 Tax=uncultured Acidimicrobiales bacterium TaxID=310071 RepID=A0A6J4IXK3_9ACTN|nr:MAG: 1-acyl-sn-glycerol-3-phosphate acyltransferase [uncultured Acidimicrobiales bacterium]
MARLPPVKKVLRRLPTTPRALAPAARFAYRLRPRSAGFPLTAPTWPASVPREPKEDTLGAGYDTAWARRYPVRLARALVVDEVERPLLRLVARPKIEGADRIAAVAGPVVFAANHASHLDTPLVLTSLPDRFRHHTVVAAGADYFFDTRLKAHLAAFLIGAVPIDRHKVSRASAEQPARLLAEGWNLLIFPEGGRSPDGWGHAHRGGAAYLGTRTGRPVVPVYLQGTRKVLKRGATWPTPSSTRVIFGAPLHPADGESSRAFASRIERAIEVLADEADHGFWDARRRAAAGATTSLRGPEAISWRRSWALAEGRRKPRAPRSWPEL